jgi:ferredoxin--NADP+ reductase
MSAFYQECVIDVQHWTDTLFSFTATRDPGFRFQSAVRCCAPRQPGHAR